MPYKVLDIANKILKYGADNEELITNLKLQKLLYYMQGFHLAYFGTPLFDSDIEAWQYGPVVPSVYYKYSVHGANGIEPEGLVIKLEAQEEKLFNQVLNVYGDYSAIGLMNMTHNESPWKTTAKGIGNVISEKKLISFFKNRIK
jgi:uncharacterized phage-associated protein